MRIEGYPAPAASSGKPSRVPKTTPQVEAGEPARTTPARPGRAMMEHLAQVYRELPDARSRKAVAAYENNQLQEKREQIAQLMGGIDLYA